MIACIADKKGWSRLDRYREMCDRTGRPSFIISTRRSCAYVEIDLRPGATFTPEEQRIVKALLNEHRTTSRLSVSEYYAWCPSVKMNALSVIVPRIEAILAGKQVAR